MREITSKFKNQAYIDFSLQNLTTVWRVVLLNLQSNKHFCQSHVKKTGLRHCPSSTDDLCGDTVPRGVFNY